MKNESSSYQDRVLAFEVEIQRIRKECEQKVADLQCSIRAVQAECPHVNKRYNYDPAGGSGGYYTCNDCFAEVD